MNKFHDELIKNLKEKKNLSDSSIKAYLKVLEKLNEGDANFKNLDFLKDKKKIDEIIEKYKPNTQRNFYIAICSILNLYPKYRTTYNGYFEVLKDVNKKLKTEEHKNIKSEAQKENWIDWGDVMKIHKELYDEVLTFKKKLNGNQYIKLLKLMVLSLYTLQPPRRNTDFIMRVVKNSNDDKKKFNYVDLDSYDFIFNNFKTKRKEGEQILSINDDLKKILNLYLSHHPLIEQKELKNKKGKIDVPFLVFEDGTPINPNNGITYLLNSIFGKNIGSSMLRHIYLTHKFGDIKKEQEEIAKAMAHSTGMQGDYIKN